MLHCAHSKIGHTRQYAVHVVHLKIAHIQMVNILDKHMDSLQSGNCFHVTLTIVGDTYRVRATEKLETQGVLPFRSPHVGALHVVLVGSRPEHLGSDLIQIEERLRVGSIVFGNFGGASLTEIQTRKKLAALTAIISASNSHAQEGTQTAKDAPEGADAGASTAHLFAGKQMEVRGVIRLNVHLSFLQVWSMAGLRPGV